MPQEPQACSALTLRLSAFAKLFDVVKNERNRCVHLIQMASQNLEKMQENSRYQENQMRIMHTTTTNYEKYE